MTRLKFFQVDAFADKAFKGNPAAVCLLDDELNVDTMQAIAAENNVAETAFVLKRDDEGFNLRWFTPTVEVNLCGHATVATAHILWQEGIIAESERAKFFTKSDWLTTTKNGDLIELDFPAYEISQKEAPEDLAKILGAEPTNTVYARDRFIVELASGETLKNLQPDFNSLRNAEMIVVTASGEGEYDFYSRSFAGGLGIDEDPVTGSSHCGLVPYWASKLNKNELFAYQASPRGGELKLTLVGDRVLIAGKAVTVIEGTFIF